MTDWHLGSLGESLAWLDRHVNLEAIERGVAGSSAAGISIDVTAVVRIAGATALS